MFYNIKHDEKKVIKEFFELLSNQWRSVLLKSDVILGLGLEGTTLNSSASREGLNLMLEFYCSNLNLISTSWICMMTTVTIMMTMTMTMMRADLDYSIHSLRTTDGSCRADTGPYFAYLCDEAYYGA